MADAPEVVPSSHHTEDDLQGDTLISSVADESTQASSGGKQHDFGNEEKSPIQALARDDRAGSGLQTMGQEHKEMLSGEETEKETAVPPVSAVDAEQRELPAQSQPTQSASWAPPDRRLLVNEWKHSFWEFWKPGGDCTFDATHSICATWLTAIRY